MSSSSRRRLAPARILGAHEDQAQIRIASSARTAKPRMRLGAHRRRRETVAGHGCPARTLSNSNPVGINASSPPRSAKRPAQSDQPAAKAPPPCSLDQKKRNVNQPPRALPRTGGTAQIRKAAGQAHESQGARAREPAQAARTWPRKTTAQAKKPAAVPQNQSSVQQPRPVQAKARRSAQGSRPRLQCRKSPRASKPKAMTDTPVNNPKRQARMNQADRARSSAATKAADRPSNRRLA